MVLRCFFSQVTTGCPQPSHGSAALSGADHAGPGARARLHWLALKVGTKVGSLEVHPHVKYVLNVGG